MASKLKMGDEVVVIAGRDKGQRGRIIGIDRDRDRVVVEGIMQMKHHVKAGRSRQGASTGGIETHEAAIHISNVALYDAAGAKEQKGNTTKKLPTTRVGFREEEVERNGRTRLQRVRVAKATGKDVE